MENVNSTTTTTLRRQQQQQQQQNFQLQQEQVQQQHEHQQQFCLRWHNHQTSLLSTLPVLLDQSHLTDVTISAEGRTLRAHRVVLSACSSFFLELFRALDATNHPVIILPGASFTAIVALLTFMYSGEVNVYEEQIPVLLNLAETLGVKGLADVQNNKFSAASKRRSMDSSSDHQSRKTEDISDAHSHSVPPQRAPSPMPTPTPPPPAPASAPPIASFNVPSHQPSIHPFANPLLAGKFPSQLENFFLKSLQFYPNLLPQPLNFSQTALNKTTELLAKYQQQCNLYQGALSTLAGVSSKDLLSSSGECSTTAQRFNVSSPPNKSIHTHEDPVALKRFCSADKLQSCGMYMQQQQQQQFHQHQHQHQQQKDLKRIDKIADNLRSGSGGSGIGTGCRQPLIGDNNTTVFSSAASAYPTTATTTNSNCNFSSTMSPQLGITKPPPIFTATSVSSASIRNQSPQQQHTTSISTISNAAESFDGTSIEEQTTRSLQQQIEHFAGCNRPSGSGSVSDVNFVLSPNTKNYESTNNNGSGGGSGNQQTLSSQATATNKNAASGVLALPISPGANAAQGKTPSNSKLYATCFICHKQLSNQYNLRVHLETHQNVRYACNVCSHVSRSKDALRKHVSYRHPGAPSPCETEARRKRASKILLGNSSSGGGSGSTASNMTAASPPTATACVSNTIIGAALDSGNNSAGNNNSEAQIAAAAAAAHLNSAAAYMFLPNQFHLAAAAAAVVQQQQHQLQQQPSPQNFSTPKTNSPAEDEIDATLSTTNPSTTIAASIKLEQHSPSSTEAISSPPTPQLHQEQQQNQQQQQQIPNSDIIPGTSRDLGMSLQRSNPA